MDMGFDQLGRKMGEAIQKAEQVLSHYDQMKDDHDLLLEKERILQQQASNMKKALKALGVIFLLSNICWLIIIIHILR